jgi:Lipocalin-like domain
MKTKLYACFVAMALLTGTADAKMKSTSLTGTWKITAAKITGPNARTITNPQPGLYIFTGTHYSITLVNSDEPRTAPPSLTNATAPELLATFQAFTANAGTYEISGANLTTRPEVAKNPGMMAQGSTVVSSFKIQGNTLTLTNVSNPNGPVANPTTLTLTRLE